MTKVYVVFGETGEYDDYTTWPVAAYLSIENAKMRADNAEAVAVSLMENKVKGWDIEDTTTINPYDVNFRLDYTGTSYYVTPVDFYE